MKINENNSFLTPENFTNALVKVTDLYQEELIDCVTFDVINSSLWGMIHSRNIEPEVSALLGKLFDEEMEATGGMNLPKPIAIEVYDKRKSERFDEYDF